MGDDWQNIGTQLRIDHKIGHQNGQTDWSSQIFPCSVSSLRTNMIGQNALGDTLSDRACAA